MQHGQERHPDTVDKGILYLVPTPLFESDNSHIPPVIPTVIRHCRHFLVESFRTGRRHLRTMAPGLDLDNCDISLLNKKTKATEYPALLQPTLNGHDICILSDAGSPAIADPGSHLVATAHHLGLRVVPLSGPSSIVLALMASGFNGQHFTFHGYLPREKGKLRSILKRLEKSSTATTQIFMETPYRNVALFEAVIKTMAPSTRLCIACDLTAPRSFVLTKEISKWRKESTPDIDKRPCIFLLG